MARAILCSALLFSLGAPAAAASFSCEIAEEVYEESLGELSGRPLHLRVCTAPDGADAQRTLVLVHWQAPEGEDDVWQTLLDDRALAPAGAYAPTLEDGVLTLRHPSGRREDPADQVTVDTWRWHEANRRFEDHARRITSSWSEGKARLDALLAAGDLAGARAEVAKLGTTPNAGLTWLDDPIYLDFLEVARREALRRHRLLDREGAAALAWEILANPPVTSPDATPKPGQIVICRDLQPTCEGEGTFNDLPAEPAVGNTLASLAFFLARGEDPGAALPLLDQLLSFFPTSGQLEVLRGEVFWELDRRDEAAAAWRRAAELGVTLPNKLRRRAGL